MVDELLLGLNGALARPDKKTASTGCPTISVTSACPTLIGISQPLVRFGQHARDRRIVLLYVAHGIAYRLPDGFLF
jgi:hypothetical protein